MGDTHVLSFQALAIKVEYFINIQLQNTLKVYVILTNLAQLKLLNNPLMRDLQ